MFADIITLALFYQAEYSYHRVQCAIKYKLDAVGPSDGSRTPAMADKLHCVVMIDHYLGVE